MPLNCITRWNSQYTQALFAQRNKLQIESTLEFAKGFPRGPSITYEARDWENTNAIVDLLKVMSRTVTVLQGNFITNSMMPLLSTTLHAFYLRKATVIGELPDHIKDAAMAMFEEFGDRFEVCTDASKIAAFIDPRTKKMSWASRYEKATFRALVVQATIKMATHEAAQKEVAMAAASGGSSSAGGDVGGGDGQDVASTPGAGSASGSSGHSTEVGVCGKKRKTTDALESEYSLLFADMLEEAELTADPEEPADGASTGDESEVAARRISMATYEVSRFETEKPLAKNSSSRQVLEWWLEQRKFYPTLYKVACVYLAVPATSAASERVFSDAGNIITKKRNRLLPENANNLIFLHGCHPVGWKLGEGLKPSSKTSGSGGSDVATMNGK